MIIFVRKELVNIRSSNDQVPTLQLIKGLVRFTTTFSLKCSNPEKMWEYVKGDNPNSIDLFMNSDFGKIFSYECIFKTYSSLPKYSKFFKENKASDETLKQLKTDIIDNAITIFKEYGFEILNDTNINFLSVKKIH